MTKKCFVFDLDDTLINEFDYLQSAFYEIAILIAPKGEIADVYGKMLEFYAQKENIFQEILRYTKNSTYEIKSLLNIYRNHYPNSIEPKENALNILQKIKDKGHYLGLVSDGRSITQRNKLKALKIENLFDLIIISEEFGTEKPDMKNFEIFNQFKTNENYYIADNTSKDFLAPNKLGWKTICLINQGKNIHQQNFTTCADYQPIINIKNLDELTKYI